MSIGSAPEIGTSFTTWGEMNADQREAWFAHMRSTWGTDLMSGYATVVGPSSERPGTAKVAGSLSY